MSKQQKSRQRVLQILSTQEQTTNKANQILIAIAACDLAIKVQPTRPAQGTKTMSRPRFTEDEMVAAGEAYWDGLHGTMNMLTTENLTSFPMQAPDSRGRPMGEARTQGLRGLLSSPNLLVYGANSYQLRQCQMHFDQLDAKSSPDGTNLNNWYLRHLIIMYFYPVHDHCCEQTIHYHKILGTGSRNKVNSHFKDVKNQLVAVLIARAVVGWGQSLTSLTTLEDLKEYPHYRVRYYMIVCPMIFFLCTEMNPQAHLNARIILETNLARVEEYMRKRVSSHGIWSQELMVEWDRQGKLNHNHKNITKGVEFKFARLCSLIVSDYKAPYNEYLQKPWKLFITQEEYNLLYTGYDPRYARDRYGVPSYHS